MNYYEWDIKYPTATSQYGSKEEVHRQDVQISVQQFLYNTQENSCSRYCNGVSPLADGTYPIGKAILLFCYYISVKRTEHRGGHGRLCFLFLAEDVQESFSFRFLGLFLYAFLYN